MKMDREKLPQIFIRSDQYFEVQFSVRIVVRDVILLKAVTILLSDFRCCRLCVSRSGVSSAFSFGREASDQNISQWKPFHARGGYGTVCFICHKRIHVFLCCCLSK